MFASEYHNLLHELKQEEDQVQKPTQPIFKISIPLEEDKMDGDGDGSDSEE